MENTVSLAISRYREAIGKGNAGAQFRNGVRGILRAVNISAFNYPENPSIQRPYRSNKPKT